MVRWLARLLVFAHQTVQPCTLFYTTDCLACWFLHHRLHGLRIPTGVPPERAQTSLSGRPRGHYKFRGMKSRQGPILSPTKLLKGRGRGGGSSTSPTWRGVAPEKERGEGGVEGEGGGGEGRAEGVGGEGVRTAGGGGEGRAGGVGGEGEGRAGGEGEVSSSLFGLANAPP